MKCLSCGKEIPDNSRQCPFCSGAVAWDVPCMACGKDIPGQAEKCPECGTEIIRG